MDSAPLPKPPGAAADVPDVSVLAAPETSVPPPSAWAPDPSPLLGVPAAPTELPPPPAPLPLLDPAVSQPALGESPALPEAPAFPEAAQPLGAAAPEASEDRVVPAMSADPVVPAMGADPVAPGWLARDPSGGGLGAVGGQAGSTFDWGSATATVERPPWEAVAADVGAAVSGFTSYDGYVDAAAPLVDAGSMGPLGDSAGQGSAAGLAESSTPSFSGGGQGYPAAGAGLTAFSGHEPPPPFDVEGAGMSAFGGTLVSEVPPPMTLGVGDVGYVGGLPGAPRLEAGLSGELGRLAFSAEAREVQQEREDFSELQQHIDDLTTEKFQLQRALESQQQALDRIQGEYDSLATARNEREVSAENHRAEIRRLEEELEAKREDVERLLSERDGFRGTSFEAQERAQQLATEVIALEEDLVQAKSGERQAQKDCKTLGRSVEKQEKELDQLRGLVEKLRRDRNARVNPKLANGGGPAVGPPPESPKGEWDPASLSTLAAALPPDSAEVLGSVHRALDALEAELGLASGLAKNGLPPLSR